MITVKAGNRCGRFVIEVDGHADAGPKGRDILCSAVTATINACLLGIQSIAEMYPEHVSFALEGDLNGGALDSGGH